MIRLQPVPMSISGWIVFSCIHTLVISTNNDKCHNMRTLLYYFIYMCCHIPVYNCMITGGSTSLSVDTALGPNVTRGPATTTQVLPLAVAGWTVSSGVHTLYEPRVTYLIISTPGAVTVSVQISVITVPEDWRPLVLLSSGLIAATIGWPLLSCCSGITIKVRDQRGILGSSTDGLHWQHLLWRNHGASITSIRSNRLYSLKFRKILPIITIADCQVHPAAPTMSGLGDYLEIAILQPGTGTSTTVSG